MPKKIDVISGILKFHIPIDRNDRKSVNAAYAAADRVLAAAPAGAQATMTTRLSRVPAPAPAPEASEPEPKSEDDGGLPDMPENLRRVPRAEPAAAGRRTP